MRFKAVTVITKNHDVSCVLSEIKYEKTSGKMDAAKIAKLQKSGADAFEYHKSQIEIINSNTIIPADIRAAVKLLVKQGIKSSMCSRSLTRF